MTTDPDTNAKICAELRADADYRHGGDRFVRDRMRYAAERIEELEADLDYHKKLCIPKTLDELEAVNLRSIILDQDADIKKLAAQLADAKADSERLDWLETNLRFLEHERSTCSVDMGGNAVRLQYNQRATKLIRAATVRAAIDAARKP